MCSKKCSRQSLQSIQNVLFVLTIGLTIVAYLVPWTVAQEDDESAEYEDVEKRTVTNEPISIGLCKVLSN